MLVFDTDGDFLEEDELETEGCLSRDLGLVLAYRDCWEVLAPPAPPDPPPTGTGLKAELLWS